MKSGAIKKILTKDILDGVITTDFCEKYAYAAENDDGEYEEYDSLRTEHRDECISFYIEDKMKGKDADYLVKNIILNSRIKYTMYNRDPIFNPTVESITDARELILVNQLAKELGVTTDKIIKTKELEINLFTPTCRDSENSIVNDSNSWVHIQVVQPNSSNKNSTR